MSLEKLAPLSTSTIHDISDELDDIGCHTVSSSFSDLAIKTATKYQCEEKPAQALDSPAPGNISLVPCRRRLLIAWGFEIFALLLSLSSIITAIAVLRSQDGKPFAEWSFATSLNTVISTLGTISKVTLAFAVSACIGQQKWNWVSSRPDTITAFERFDEASRGPFGSTRLLLWLQARHWASFGALVTIGSLLFEPFLQAVISSVGDLNTLAIGNATVNGQSTYLQAGQGRDMWLRDSEGRLQIPNSYAPTRPDFGLVSAIYSGLYNSSAYAAQTVNHVCGTGNCTWPVYASLAFCTSCVDVSDEIGITARGDLLTANHSRTIYTLPYARISNYNGFRGKIEPVSTSIILNTTTDTRQTISLKHSETLLMSFLVMEASKDYMNRKVRWEESRPVATECGLYLCVNAYRTKVQNGIFMENVTGSWAQKDPDSYQTTITEEFYPSTGIPAANIPTNGLFNDRYRRTNLRLQVPQSSSDDSLSASDGAQFTVEHIAIASTVSFLVNLTDNKKQIGYPWPEDFQNSAQRSNVSQPLIVDALQSSTNITTTFGNLAQMLTIQIRNGGGRPQMGTMQQWIIRIRVQWVFLAFPLALVGIGCLYVVLTIVETSRLHLPAWKETALPTLIYGLDERTQNSLREAQSSSNASSLSRATIIRFDKDQGRLLVVDP